MRAPTSPKRCCTRSTAGWTRAEDPVGPKTEPLLDDVLDYDTVMASLDHFMDWLAVQYISALNLIHYMHDKYSYEASLMALHDRDVYRTMACGIAGRCRWPRILSAIKYATVKPVRDHTGLAVDFVIEGDLSAVRQQRRPRGQHRLRPGGALYEENSGAANLPQRAVP